MQQTQLSQFLTSLYERKLSGELTQAAFSKFACTAVFGFNRDNRANGNRLLAILAEPTEVFAACEVQPNGLLYETSAHGVSLKEVIHFDKTRLSRVIPV